MAVVIDLVPHMDAGDRKTWPGDQDERPLSELGRRQAAALADALAGGSIDAIYAGPALRCRQSVDVLAERPGLKTDVIAELGEKRAWRAPDGWDPSISRAAFAAGTIALALEKLQTLYPDGRVVACSHGHTIPAFVAYHVGSRGLSNVPPLEYRGQWYRLRFVGRDVAIDRVEVKDFPR